MSIWRSILNSTFNRLIHRPVNVRSLSITPVACLKEIKEMKDGNNIIVYANHIESPRVPFLLKTSCDDSCILCQLNLDIKHTDVLILSQFVRSDGCMLSRRITKLCLKQQKKMSTLVTMAQKAGLIPNLNPANSKKDPKRRFGWKKHNNTRNTATLAKQLAEGAERVGFD
ncbi:hypothetical protein Trydic_g22225 [Trypoxylus dichotomus]